MDATLDGVDGMEKLLQQMRGLMNNMKSSSTETEFTNYVDNISDLMDQYDKLAQDASYDGVNLISGTSAKLDVPFGVNLDHKISIGGVHLLSKRYDVPPLPEESYNPLMDKTLVNAFRNLTDVRDLTNITEYTRLLGFGLSLFSKAREAYGFGNRVDKYLQAINAKEVGFAGHPVFDNTGLNVLKLALVLPSVGLTRAAADYLDTDHNANLYQALALLGIGESAMTGRLTGLFRDEQLLRNFLSLVEPAHTEEHLKLKFNDWAVLHLAKNGHMGNLAAKAIGKTLKDFINLVYVATDMFDKPSNLIPMEDIVSLFTFDSPPELQEVDARYLSAMKKYLSLYKAGFGRLMANPSVFSAIAWTNNRLFKRYKPLFQMLAGTGRTSLSKMLLYHLQAGDIDEFQKLFAPHTSDRNVSVQPSIYSLLRKAGVFDKPFSNVFVRIPNDNFNILRQPSFIIDYLNRAVHLPGVAASRLAKLGGPLRAALGAADAAITSKIYFTAVSEISKFVKSFLAGNVNFPDELAALLRSFVSQILTVDTFHLTNLYNKAQLAHIFQRESFYKLRTGLLQDWRKTDLSAVQVYVHQFFDKFLQRPMFVGTDYNKDTAALHAEQAIIERIFDMMTKQIAPSLLETHTALIAESYIGEGTTAMRKAIDWLRKIDFDRVYKSGELSREVQVAVSNIESASKYLEQQIARFGSIVDLLEIRLDFTSSYVQHMKMGAGKLVLADTNEEGAKMMALQTRQQMAFKSLGIAGSQEQNILQLIR